MGYEPLQKDDIGLITMPLIKAGYVPVTNMVLALSHISKSLYVITSNEIKQRFINNSKIEFADFNSNLINSLSGPLMFLYLQLHTSLLIWRSRKNIKMWVFFLDSHTLLLPIIMAKITNKSVIIALASSNRNTIKMKKNLLLHFLVYSEHVSLRLADRILIYSSNLIIDWQLQKHQDKIKLYTEHIIDFSTFFQAIDLSHRDRVIAYIGRLSEEKGIINFIHSIPHILKYDSRTKFFIGGDGPLKDAVLESIQDLSLGDNVEFYGWIDHDDLPKFLNKIKMIVIPSYSEGLPNIILESMACGTPVLANQVGSIPNIVNDGVTGFLMEDNSSICIANNVIKILNSDNLEIISNNCQEYVKKEFNLNNTIKKLEIAFADL